ncbi:hypothetical protein AVEN_180668-1 [Araneus ventricosus]|uniref:Uncharacterized protein n=1 Tax=Araneus ventricosus TaxID=182803 RepID=A0A4Y2VRX0_ARAVE|nr:hypothetical protein AVEN_180668-1 [Araneus ventricosus]
MYIYGNLSSSQSSTGSNGYLSPASERRSQFYPWVVSILFCYNLQYVLVPAKLCAKVRFQVMSFISLLCRSLDLVMTNSMASLLQTNHKVSGYVRASNSLHLFRHSRYTRLPYFWLLTQLSTPLIALNVHLVLGISKKIPEVIYGFKRILSD